MGNRGFDYTRHYIKRIHPDSGLRVGMYKDDPGVYVDMKGNAVDETIAEQCGFDIDAYAKDRLRKSMLEDKEAEVNAYMRDLDEKIEAKVEASVAAPEPAPAKEVYQPAEKTPFASSTDSRPEVVRLNSQDKPRETTRREMQGGQAGRWTVIDKDTGETVHTAKYVDTETAEALLLEKAS